MYTTPALADDVADLAAAMSLPRINIYGVSYGTRWALEVMRRHPNLVRAAVLDGVYPPQVNGEQNEPDIVRRAFEQLYTDCANDTLCRESSSEPARHRRERDRSGAGQAAGAQAAARGRSASGAARRAKLLMVLLHMMREGEAALIPETVERHPAQRPSGC